MSYVIQNPDEFRKNVRQKFVDIMNSCRPHDANEKHCANLEIGIYNYSIKECNYKKIVKSWNNLSFCQLYIDHLRSVYFNFKPPLIIQIVEKVVKPQDVAFMTHQEWDESLWKELIDKKTKRDDSKFNVNVEDFTSMFTCKRCQSKKCTYYELQIRSADEPATIFITCLNCGKRWRE